MPDEDKTDKVDEVDVTVDEDKTDGDKSDHAGELAAAHARVTVLEAEVAELRKTLVDVQAHNYVLLSNAGVNTSVVEDVVEDDDDNVEFEDIFEMKEVI